MQAAVNYLGVLEVEAPAVGAKVDVGSVPSVFGGGGALKPQLVRVSP